ncbi:alpha-1,3-mannosyl-glycoprotein 4-beta-N-acetylglucosaminyltransferase A-like [Clytia hemisphaerica]
MRSFTRYDICVQILSLFFLLVCCRVIFLQLPSSSCIQDRRSQFLNEIFSYDGIGNGIKRRDAFITGKISYERKAPLLIGIPTVYRSYKNKTTFYLDRTIKSLIEPLSKEDKRQVNILVVLADTEENKKRFIYQKLNDLFPNEIRSGLIGMIGIPKRFYLPLHDLTPTFNDTSERMYWRSKQSLDYAFIFQYVQNLCDYYLQIEDDVLANDQYFDTIMEDINRLNNARNKEPVIFKGEKETRLKHKPWVISEYYKMGFIGRLIPAHYLDVFAGFFKVFYNELPVDWGYPYMLDIMDPGFSEHRLHVSLFTHIGKISSSIGT